MAEPDTRPLEPEQPDGLHLDGAETTGGLRREWVVNPKAQRRAAWVAAAMGAWGVLCGWLVFVKVLAEEEEKLSLGVFVFALLVASLVGLVSETMQELIKGGRGDEVDGRDAPLLRVIARDSPRIVFLIVMIALFDLYSDAGSDFVKAWGKGRLQGMFEHTLLPPLEGVGKPPWLDFVVMVLLWTAVGAVVAYVLARGVIGQTGVRRRQAQAGLAAGLLAGCVAAPAGVLLYILLLRVVTVVYLILFEHAKWDKYLSHLASWSIPWGLPVYALDWLAHVPYTFLRIPYVGGLAVLGAVAWLLHAGFRQRDNVLLRILLVGGALVVVAPLGADLGNLLLLLAFAALIWSVPGAVLGMSVPYLKRPSRRPRIWGPLALFMGGALALLTWYRLTDSGFYVAAFLLLFAGWLLLRSGRIEDYWPLLALCVAMVICGVTSVFQQITFIGVFERVHAVNSLPHDVRANVYTTRLQEDRVRFIQEHLSKTGLLAPEHPYVTEIKARVGELDKLPVEEQLARIDGGLPREIEEKKMLVVDSVWRALYWSPPPTNQHSLLAGLYGKSLKQRLSEIDAGLAAEVEEAGRLPLEEQLKKIEELKARVEAAANVEPAPGDCSARTSPAGLTFPGPAWSEPPCVYRRAAEGLDRRREYLEMMLVRRQYPPEVYSPIHFGLRSVPNTTELLDALRDGLLQRRERLAARLTALEAKRRWEEERIAQKLELSLTGSLGFWVTVGLLAGWAFIRNQRLVEPGPDGTARCFWAKGDLLAYHDREHGREPADDRELFRRLSLELLVNNTHWREREFFERLFEGFVPERVATMSAEDFKRSHEGLTDDAERRALGTNLKDGVPAVIENAKRLVALYRVDPRQPDSTGRTLLDELRLLARTDEAALVERVQTFFRLRKTTPVGTFLQAVGLGRGAHYEGCTARSG
jgi:3-methyladenine DNA glycosylase Tag